MAFQFGGGPLSTQERGDFTHVYTFTADQLVNNATSTGAVGTLPAGAAVDLAVVYEKTPIVGASNITVDVGTTQADPDEFINALDVDGLNGSIAKNTGDAFTAGLSGGCELVGATNADKTIYIEFNGTTGSITAGEVVIGLRVLDPNRF